MCGVAGILGPGPLEQIWSATARMVAAQEHRGPDDGGQIDIPLSEGGSHVVLGSRRLAILDLSMEGHQPMQNERGSVWLVYNGEVYNFQELRKELIAKGHRFRSESDTEVILHLYDEHGPSSIAMLEGMFAIGIWDHDRQLLLLARDRLGEKPLYFCWDGSRFLFASEIRALLQSGLIDRCVDPAAVAAFLNLGSVPTPLTIIKGVRSLEPGSMLTLKNGEVSIHRYWNLNFGERASLPSGEAAAMVHDHLRKAIRSRLTSDVPIGVFLSGGLDSTTIVSLVREAVVGDLKTFSLRFEQPELDEGYYSQLASQTFETDHTEHLITADEVWRELDDVVAAMDQPSIDGINAYFVSKLARSSGSIVAFSGLGGDEIFGGYSSFWLIPKLYRLGKLANSIGGGRAVARAIVRLRSKNARSEKIQQFFGRSPSTESAYLTVRGLFLDDGLKNILLKEFHSETSDWDPIDYLEGFGCGHEDERIGNRISRLELGSYMQNQLLRDTDAMSMAHSLEVRSPLLDHKLVELVANIPSDIKFNQQPKSLLIDAMKQALPREIIERPKGGFSFPMEIWFRKEWKGYMKEMVFTRTGQSEEIFNQDGIEELWTSFLSGRMPWIRLWAVLILQSWINKHIHGSATEFVDPGSTI